MVDGPAAPLRADVPDGIGLGWICVLSDDEISCLCCCCWLLLLPLSSTASPPRARDLARGIGERRPVGRAAVEALEDENGTTRDGDTDRDVGARGGSPTAEEAAPPATLPADGAAALPAATGANSLPVPLCDAPLTLRKIPLLPSTPGVG